MGTCMSLEDKGGTEKKGLLYEVEGGRIQQCFRLYAL